MLGKLALQRTNVGFTHLTALAVMAALVVGLFGLMGSASAANGSVTVEIGEIDNTTVTGLDSVYDTAVTPETPASDSNADDDIARVSISSTNLEVVGVRAGTTTATVTDGDDSSVPALTYEITVLPFGFAKIESDDSDNIVKAGTKVLVTATLNSQLAESTVTLTLPTTGLSIAKANPSNGVLLTDSNAGTTQDQTINTVDTTYNAGVVSGRTASFTINTAGAPAGPYVFTFVADRDGDATTTTTDRVSDTSYSLTIGDPGTGLASATLGPNNVNADGTAVSATGSPDKTTKAKGSTVHLVVTAKNSLGDKSNPADVSQVIVFAVGATIDGLTEVNTKTIAENSTTTGDDVGATVPFTVTRTKPGTVTVSATVVGNAGDVKTNEVELIFTGDAEEISVAEPSDQLGQRADSITVEVTASDDAGNPATISPLQLTSVKLLDGDGNPAKNLTATEDQKFNDKDQDRTKDPGEDDIATAVVVTIKSTDVASAKAAPGAYTLEVKLGSKSTATADFVVVGDAADVEASADVAELTVGELVTINAAVTDKDGNPVVDKTKVQFTPAGSATLVGIGAIVDDNTNAVTSESDDGEASARFYVSKGAGVTSIIVTIDEEGVDAYDVVTFTIASATAEAMPEEEASVSCLSNLSGFSTWSCGVESSAAEIFGLVSGRGASAVHLWNGSEWVRYSVVEGAMVPGSSDFMVTEDDILYISN